MTRLILLFFAFILHATLFSGEIIVADLEDHIEGREQYTYAFAPGDIVTINVQTIKGSIDELKVVEYPDADRYKVYKAPKQYNQSFAMPNGGFLTLQMIKISTGKAKVKIRITRENADEAFANFPTMVKWQTVYDTLWIMGNPADIKADTLFEKKVVREPTGTDTLAYLVTDRRETLQPSTGAVPYTANVNVYFPKNEQSDIESRELISWAYFLSSGESAPVQGEYLIQGVHSVKDPVAALALGLVDVIAAAFDTGLPFGYKLMYRNPTTEVEVLDEGYGTGVYGYKNVPKQGAFTIALTNPAPTEVDVHVRVIAAIRHTAFRTDTVQVVKKIVVKQPKQSAFKLIERKIPYNTIVP